ncbi:SGNH/GDSL hydrolase family protein [Paenibacillus sp. CN-4]|uniref:SGNH/GDSL hydrolase family protein n=1 Tax=Paenibacillus nanchangensis TaxID=3348343 RepID=UPI00397AC666
MHPLLKTIQMREDSAKPTILFLGDSITASGEYIRYTRGWLGTYRPDINAELIGLGLPSETASGLSEPAHPFPRPCIHDRLESALEANPADIVVACYGMNDGIYHPFSEERFAAYREGMLRLGRRIRDTGAAVVFMTPPPFDAASSTVPLVPEDASDFSYLTPYREYDRVLERYAGWLLSGECLADAIIDLRTPLLEHIRRERALDPEYRSGDGIHPNPAGHRVMAQTLLSELFCAEAEMAELEEIGRLDADNAD